MHMFIEKEARENLDCFSAQPACYLIFPNQLNTSDGTNPL